MCIHFNIWYIYIENGMAKNEQYTATLWIEWNIYQKSTASSELINSIHMLQMVESESILLLMHMCIH